MPPLYQIRATFDASSIVMYQAYHRAIADAAVAKQTFVSPFSFNRMTWIKPSLCWLLYRSNFGQKKGQERILRIRIRRSGFDTALSQGVLTSPDGPVFQNRALWDSAFQSADVHIQWDTERSLKGAPLNHYSIQVGLGRRIIQTYVDQWILSIEDISPIVEKIREAIHRGQLNIAKRYLPKEQVYEVSPNIAGRLMID